MICLIINIGFGDHETAKRGTRSMTLKNPYLLLHILTSRAFQNAIIKFFIENFRIMRLESYGSQH